MSEKNRIMELYRAGIITKEDAIRLLEEHQEEMQTVERETGVKVSIQSIDELSKRAEQLVSRMTSFSTAIDQKNLEMKQLNELITQKKDVLKKYLTSEASKIESPDIVEATKIGIEYSINELEERLQIVTQEKETLEARMKAAQPINLEDKINRLLTTLEAGEWGNLANDTRETISEVMPSLKEKLRYYSEQVSEKAREGSTNLNLNRKEVTSDPIDQVVQAFDASQEATILDLKLAAGTINVQPSSDGTYRIEAVFDTVFNFTESEFQNHIARHLVTRLTDEETKIHFSSRQVNCHLTVYLPDRVMDHVSLKVITGDVSAQGMKGQDYFVKIKTGQARLTAIEGTMLEVNVQTGQVNLQALQMKDLVVGLKTGDVQLTGSVEGASIYLQTGELRLALDEHLRRLRGELKTGSVRWYQMNYPALEADFRTKLGKVSVPYLLEAIEVVEESDRQLGHVLKFHTLTEADPVVASIRTSVGQITGIKGGLTDEDNVE